MKEIEELMEVKPEIIAIDATIDERPEKAKRVIELGAFSVVVGSIITRSQQVVLAEHMGQCQNYS